MKKMKLCCFASEVSSSEPFASSPINELTERGGGEY